MHPPADVLASGREEPQWSPPPWLSSRRTRWAALVLAAVAAAAFAVEAGAGGQPAPPDVPVPRLALVDTPIPVSLGGVLVVPVELSSPDSAVRVRSAQITAAPVRTTSLVTAPDGVPQGGSRRLAVIVDPDCTVVGPGIGGELVATLVVRVALPSGEEQDLRLAVGEAPAVRDVLAGLCGNGRTPALDDPDAGGVQDLLQDEALEVGLEVRKLDLGDGG